jgi:adenosine kinase
MSTDAHAHPLLVGIGNPLLDISAPVPADVLDKYGVKAGNAILAEEKHLPIYDELVQNYPVEYIAGGATQNSIRVAQWMSQHPNGTAYIGAVGKDRFADELRKSAESDGVRVLYYDETNKPTGTCAVLLVDKERSLIANLSAANSFAVEHLHTEPVKKTLDNAKVFYSAGFFLTVSPPSLMHIAKHAAEHNKILCGNLSAPFICEFFYDPLVAAIPYFDFLFGNESEAQAFGKRHGIADQSVEAIAAELSRFPKVNGQRPRAVIITQGAESTIVAIDGKVKSFPVPKIDPALIVDLNGAGDAFVGGFLSVMMKHAHDPHGVLERAIDAGHFAASTIIQVSGTKLTGKPKEF